MTESRSVMRRKALQKGEEMPTFKEDTELERAWRGHARLAEMLKVQVDAHAKKDDEIRLMRKALEEIAEHEIMTSTGPMKSLASLRAQDTLEIIRLITVAKT